MTDLEGHSDAVARREQDGSWRFAVLLLLGIAGLVVAGWAVIVAVDALETDADCGSYGYGGGYGGYGCEPDRTDGRIAVEPSTDLVDRQTVTLTGTKFDPNTQFGAAQCDADLAIELQSPAACDLVTAVLGRTDSNGNIELTMRVRRIIVVQGEEVDCAERGACIIGGATIPDLITPLEAGFVEISFDPSVPPVPRLAVNLTVDRLTTSEVSGLVTCNRGAQFSVNAAVSQTKSQQEVFAYGYSAASATCGTTPVRWTAPLFSYSGRLTGGPAEYEVYGYAFDGFETAFGEVEGETRLRGGRRPTVEPEEVFGETVRVSIVGASGRGDDLAVDLLVTCNPGADTGYVSVQLSQWAGLSQIHGYGNAPLGACNGPTPLSVPVTPQDGAFAGGPAQVRAFVSVQEFTPPSSWFYDSASASGSVKLQGSTKPRLTFQPNPGSRITISAATATSVSGTVVCDQPGFVYLWSEVEQLSGRTLRSAYGSTEIACDGTTGFTIEVDGNLAGGNAYAFVYGTAYRRIEADPYPIYEYLWNDRQAAEVQLRR